MYKIVNKEDYEKYHSVDHPNAVCSPDGSEYVLSNEGEMTKQETVAYISNNWQDPEGD